jgi:NTE family protein
MAASHFERPDVLVLGAGGVLGEAWLTGVLAGIEDVAGIDFRACDTYVGTSAGSIVAATLVSGRRPRRPHSLDEPDAPSEPVASALAGGSIRARRVASRVTALAAAPVAPLALSAATPGGALMRAAILSRVPRPRTSLHDLRRRVERSGARFDGRLRIAVVDRRRGRRVMLGAPGSPKASVGAAVEASCAVPWLFAPVRIGSREYVDGGVWSVTNLDAAPAGAGTQVLCLNPVAGTVDLRSLFGVLRSASRSAAGVEALALRRRGASVKTIAPDDASVQAMGGDFMRTGPGDDVLVAGYRQGRRIGTRGGG